MVRRSFGSVLPLFGLFLVGLPGCVRSVCSSKSDCPSGSVCSNGACIKACTVDTDCPSGRFCDRSTGLCPAGCRTSDDCAGGGVCVENQCWVTDNPIASVDGGSDDGGGSACSCLQAPRACLEDINPASRTVGTSVCEPSAPPRATALFFGNVGCSHCQAIFGNLLLLEAELRSQGWEPELVFVQLNTWTYTGDQVTSTFPTQQGPVLQDTVSEDMWARYGADWYEVKLIDSHGCLSAFFSASQTQDLIVGGQVQASGEVLMDAWRSAMEPVCHGMPDAAAGAAP